MMDAQRQFPTKRGDGVMRGGKITFNACDREAEAAILCTGHVEIFRLVLV